ncbi:hypothetical protein LENED_008102 [Lentinula edodes]|uniref:Uncharacterized protein n=1 Tax=Lentinula edodes TaxID=5353 RepID=A0A1Q3EGA6_LENED|nr:hypothetical protein LENED_008102 [Lentinula edodes]
MMMEEATQSRDRKLRLREFGLCCHITLHIPPTAVASSCRQWHIQDYSAKVWLILLAQKRTRHGSANGRSWNKLHELIPSKSWNYSANEDRPPHMSSSSSNSSFSAFGFV